VPRDYEPWKAAYPPAIVSALRLDGEAFFAAETIVFSDTPSTPGRRARAVVPDDVDLYGVCGLSALWVQGVISEPRRHSITLLTPKRPSHAVLNTRIVRELDLTNATLVDYEGRKCLSVLDAAEEVARNPFIPTSVATQAIAFAIAQRSGLHDDLRCRVNRLPAAPYTELARTRLAVANAIDIVDGVNATNRIEHSLQVDDIAHLKDESAER
jgi:hypothetical protein